LLLLLLLLPNQLLHARCDPQLLLRLALKLLLLLLV
jgi:hypothetical protein